MKMKDDIGIVQITNKNTKRKELLLSKIVPTCCRVCNNHYVLVSPPDEDLEKATKASGGHFEPYFGWERDMSRKWRQGIHAFAGAFDWLAFFADDILPDENWMDSMKNYLKDKKPGQYGFRLTDEEGKRHVHGEDWMQFPNAILGTNHRPLQYNVEFGTYEDSPTAYVANCVVHKEVLAMVEPFGLYKAAPDVQWSFAIRECGFPIGFGVEARAFHLGHRKDNR